MQDIQELRRIGLDPYTRIFIPWRYVDGPAFMDWSGRGNKVELTGALVKDYFLRTDGTDDFGSLPIKALEGMESEGTILMWVRAEWSTVGINDVKLLTGAHSAGVDSSFFQAGNLRIRCSMGYGATTVYADAYPIPSTPPDNEWLLAHWKWYESGGSYYVQAGHNGSWLNTSDAAPNAFVMPDTSLHLAEGGGLYFPGDIGEVLIKNYPLSGLESMQYYNDSKRRYR